MNIRPNVTTAGTFLLGLGLLLSACAPRMSASADSGLNKIKHVVVIYAENRSFDNLYGLFPGANGIAQATQQNISQVDRGGSVLATLPPSWDSKSAPDPAYPQGLPNQPFRIDAPPTNLPPSTATRDLVHRFYQNQMQINGGKNNKFAAYTDAGGLTMGYYDGSGMAMWKLAQQYTLADNFFMGGFGGSFFNHIWLACACAPTFPGAPDSMKAQVEADGVTLKTKDTSPASALEGPPQFLDGALTPDGYAVNTVQPSYQPSGAAPVSGGDLAMADPSKYPLPPQTQPTLGDRLSAKDVSWAWFSGGWNDALKDGMQDPSAKRNVIYSGETNFQPHHQPYNYFANYAPGTAARAQHLKDVSDFTAALAAGKLPSVSFIKPQGNLNQHPGYAEVMAGDAYVAGLVAQIQQSPAWKDTAIIVTYDENGGFWDHAAPPSGDRWGPGTRIPAIIISPYAKKGYVDHQSYDTTSVLKFISKRFNLEALPGFASRPNAGDLTNAFDFTQTP